MNDCIFCKIVAGEVSSYLVWEDEKHMAFLTPFPNTDGFTVVITKEHYPSYVADLPSDVRNGLMDAVCTVAHQIDQSFKDVGRTGIMFEGFGLDHIHAKLFPMHGTEGDGWKQRASREEKFFETYEGYISSHDAAPADAKKLEEIASKIRNA